MANRGSATARARVETQVIGVQLRDRLGFAGDRLQHEFP